MENEVAQDQEVNDLKFKVQGLEQDVRELQAAVNKLLGNEKRSPADPGDTPAPQRNINTF